MRKEVDGYIKRVISIVSEVRTKQKKVYKGVRVMEGRLRVKKMDAGKRMRKEGQ